MDAHEVAAGYLLAVGAVGLAWAIRAVGWRRILDSYRRHE
jgi:uncharacterized membrane protein YbhN (UPF0104 family)